MQRWDGNTSIRDPYNEYSAELYITYIVTQKPGVLR